MATNSPAGLGAAPLRQPADPARPGVGGTARDPREPAQVLMPSRLRLDSMTLLAHGTLLWLPNCIFCVLLLLALQGQLEVRSWWLVFSPLLVGHTLHIPYCLLLLTRANHAVRQQLGPPPPHTASIMLHAQYSLMRSIRVRTHIIDAINVLLDSSAALAIKATFAAQLQAGDFAKSSMRLTLAPAWAAWALTVLLACAKHRNERMLGSRRDLAFIFLLFVAFKVDGQSAFSWRLVFIVPWLWFASLSVLALFVGLLLLFSKVWARPWELILPLGFFWLLATAVAPHVTFMVALCKRLDGDTLVTLPQILIPAAVGWGSMWLASVLLALGLREKERVRSRLLGTGAVWTAHENIARRLQGQRDREGEQHRVDTMTDDEVEQLVEQLMSARTVSLAPARLLRVGPTLYKQLAGAGSIVSHMAAGAAGAAAQLAQDISGVEDSAYQRLAVGEAARAQELALVPLGGGTREQQGRGGEGEGGTQARGVGLGGEGTAAGGWVGGPAASEAGAGMPGAHVITVHPGHLPAPLPPGQVSGQPGGLPQPASAPLNETPGLQGVLATGQAPQQQQGGGSWQSRDGSPAGALAASAQGQLAAAAADGGTGTGAAGDPPPTPTPLLRATSSPVPLQALPCGHCPEQPDPVTPSHPLEPATALGGSPAGTPSTTTAAAAGHPPHPPHRPTSQPTPHPAQAHQPTLSAVTSQTSLPPSSSSSSSSSSSGAGGSGCRGLGPSSCRATRPRHLNTGPAAAPSSPLSLDSTHTRPGTAASAPTTPTASSSSSSNSAARTPGWGSSKGRSSRAGQGRAQGEGGAGQAARQGPPDSLTAGQEGPGAGAAAAPSHSHSLLQQPGETAKGVLGTGGGEEPPLPSPSPSGASPIPPSTHLPLTLQPSPSSPAPGGGEPVPGQQAAGEMRVGMVEGSWLEAAAVRGPLPGGGDSSSTQPAATSTLPRLQGGTSTSTLPASINTGASEGPGAGGLAMQVVPEEGVDDGLCVICYDKPSSCVFLDCGHGGFCKACAYRIFVRPPNECPTCRQHIEQVLQLDALAPVGHLVSVRRP